MNTTESDRPLQTERMGHVAKVARTAFLLAVVSLILYACETSNELDGSSDAVTAGEQRANKESNKNNPLNPAEGIVYTMSNDPVQNSIVSFLQNPNGTLSPKATTPSGGAGTGTGLGSQGALALDAGHHWLFAVNAGSNSVSSFKVDAGGDLTLAHTVASGGVLPISLTVSGNLLYVVNSTTSNISGFTIGDGGSLNHIAGSDQPLSDPGAAPAQISFKPGGGVLVVAEKMTNKITTFPVDDMGAAGPGTSFPSAGVTPFGFDFSGSNYIVVSEATGGAPNASTVTSYSVSGTGAVNASDGLIAIQQTAACWVATSRDGYSFVTNTGSNNISSLLSSPDGSLQLIDEVAATTDAGPIDITFSGDQSYIYNVNAASHTITEYKRRSKDKLQRIGSVQVPPYAVGLVAF